MKLQAHIPVIDHILDDWRSDLGADYIAYRNHCYRVYNFCYGLSGAKRINEEKIGISAAFHDLGIWTARSFDYLEPSKNLAREYLMRSGRPEMVAEIEAMIDNHHKLTAYPKNSDWLVEPFRKADWVDISMGVLKFKLQQTFVRNVLTFFPNNGFHKRLGELTLQRMRRHPFSPLPMMKI
ncbi:MAG: hypothetical protein OEY01_01200 [Desulfobulbaceae bacterium]|nr:hypothetical protein [Desulfobulbaceae bacterium]HIJ77909.1 phosphohydrolase [Deltaproteobacteria bacterium]